MQPISGLIPGAARPSASAAGVKELSKARRPEAGGRPQKPVTDEYVPEEKQLPAGRYWPGRDEDGKPKIYFDDPGRAAGAHEKTGDAPNSDSPERITEAPQKPEGIEAPERGKKEPAQNAKRCTVNTDQVDREIEKLKKKRQELEQRLNAETDEARRKDLETELAQVERELSRKDNDAYRRQHAAYTYS